MHRSLSALALVLALAGCARTAPPATTSRMDATAADRLAIRELVDRYNDAVNHRNWVALEALFATESVWEVAPPISLKFEGAQKIAAGIQWSVGRLEFLVQSSSAIVVELQGADRATARSTLIEFGRSKEAGMRAAGTYYDDVVKERGEWRFKHRTLRVRYMDSAESPGEIYDNRPPR